MELNGASILCKIVSIVHELYTYPYSDVQIYWTFQRKLGSFVVTEVDYKKKTWIMVMICDIKANLICYTFLVPDERLRYTVERFSTTQNVTSLAYYVGAKKKQTYKLTLNS